MSDIKDISFNPRLQNLVLAVVVRRCWAYAPVIHAASHFYHEKRVAWVSIYMHACDPVPIVIGLRLAALRAAGAPLILGNLSRYDGDAENNVDKK